MLKTKDAQTAEQAALAANFAKALEESGISPKAIADARQITEQAVSNWKRTGKIKREHLPTIASLTGWSVEELLTGRGSTATAPAAATEYLPGFEQLSIPVLANSGSMGTGSEQLHDEVVVGRLTVSPQWVARTVKPTALENLRFIHGYGDSMEPTFIDGDVLLVDVGVQHPKIDGVYVLEANDRIYIKRVRQRMDGSYEISSDNPTVKTVDVLDGSNPVNVRGASRVGMEWKEDVKEFVAGALAAICGLASAQLQPLSPPVAADLQAAYCIGMYRIGNQTDPEVTRRIDRLRGYLVPRLQFLDSTGLQVASQQAERDFEYTLTSVGTCVQACGQAKACVDRCQPPPDIMQKVGRCKALDFLPY